MTNTLAPPSRNPTIDRKLRTVLRFVFSKLVQGVLDDMLPAKIIAYDRASNMATVQPLIQVVTTLNQIQERPQVARIPVVQMGGGGFLLNFPMKPGDLGFIKSNDRDISLFTQFWRMTQPNSGRMHNFADSVFVPAFLTGFTIDASDADNVVLQKADSTVRLSIGSGAILVTDQAAYSASASAMLDVQSTTGALCPPNMTVAQRNAITSPKGGSIVYVTDGSPPHLSVYQNGVWS